jgi:hypothetical protein
VLLEGCSGGGGGGEKLDMTRYERVLSNESQTRVQDRQTESQKEWTGDRRSQRSNK